MVQETIQAVKEAESKADVMRKRAEEEGRHLIEQAKEQAEAKKNDMMREAIEQAVIDNEVAAAASDQYMQKMQEQAEKEIALLKQKAEEKAEQAIHQIIESLV